MDGKFSSLTPCTRILFLHWQIEFYDEEMGINIKTIHGDWVFRKDNLFSWVALCFRFWLRE